MLAPDLQRLWAEYLAAERDRIRDVMMPALDRFIDRLLAQSPAEWRQWAKETAAAVAERQAEVPVRFPLFRRVLLPALADGIRRLEPGCARWLAHFESFLANSKEVELPDHLRTAVGLLREAVRVDPSDDLARRRLVQRLAGYLEYTLHELPDGVLYGADGATEQECDELLALLLEFKAHVRLIGQLDIYAELVRDCEMHYAAYRDYLRTGRPEGSYEVYLAGRCGAEPNATDG